MKLVRTIHPKARWKVGALAEVASDVGIQTNGGPAPICLAFSDPDGSDVHVYLLDDESKRKLAAALTGGIVVAASMPPH